MKPAKQNRSDEELAMRALVVPELRRRWPEARVVHELPLRYSERRIDLAAICEDKIIAVEIKSSRDVADRLEGQLRGFLPISWLVIAALAPKWNTKLPMEAEKGRNGGTVYRRQLTPAQATIEAIGRCSIETWTVDAGAASINVTDRAHSRNEFPWAWKLLELLWVAELKAVAGAHRICMGKKLTHADLVRECAELMTGREIRRAVCRALRGRQAFAEGSDPPMRSAPRQDFSAVSQPTLLT